MYNIKLYFFEGIKRLVINNASQFEICPKCWVSFWTLNLGSPIYGGDILTCVY
jgi:hypothetical protein